MSVSVLGAVSIFSEQKAITHCLSVFTKNFFSSFIKFPISSGNFMVLGRVKHQTLPFVLGCVLGLMCDVSCGSHVLLYTAKISARIYLFVGLILRKVCCAVATKRVVFHCLCHVWLHFNH